MLCFTFDGTIGTIFVDTEIKVINIISGNAEIKSRKIH
jgi:hypothetical protein